MNQSTKKATRQLSAGCMALFILQFVILSFGLVWVVLWGGSQFDYFTNEYGEYDPFIFRFSFFGAIALFVIYLVAGGKPRNILKDINGKDSDDD